MHLTMHHLINSLVWPVLKLEKNKAIPKERKKKKNDLKPPSQVSAVTSTAKRSKLRLEVSAGDLLMSSVGQQ
jgi:hypothetical protein